MPRSEMNKLEKYVENCQTVKDEELYCHAICGKKSILCHLRPMFTKIFINFLIIYSCPIILQACSSKKKMKQDTQLRW